MLLVLIIIVVLGSFVAVGLVLDARSRRLREQVGLVPRPDEDVLVATAQLDRLGRTAELDRLGGTAELDMADGLAEKKR